VPRSRPGWRPAAALVLLACVACPVHARETERFGRFGEVVLYRSTPHPTHVVLFVSGDGGWNQGVVDMAEALADLDSLVVGIDVRTYLASLRKGAEPCLYPAADFEALSQSLQKKLDFPSYRTPLLVGYSSGATLVYATLAQAPPNTFLGGLSLGFCPELAVTKPFCQGTGLHSKPDGKGQGIRFDPIAEIASPWIAFQGTIDQVCDAKATERYVSGIRGAEVVLLPGVGHGFSVQRNWMPQLRTRFARLVGGEPRGSAEPGSTAEEIGAPTDGSPDASLADLPLVEVTATAGHTDTLAFVASGDGGWASLDKDLAGVFASRGIPVVGLDTLRYYWQARSADESANALERILRHYLALWKKERVLLVGYSRGADVLPFMASRLPSDLADRVDLIALLGPGTDVAFEFHYTDWISSTKRTGSHSVQPEVEKLRGRNILCVYGADESDSLCPRLPAGLARLDRRPGGHHFGGDYRSIADRILTEAGR